MFSMFYCELNVRLTYLQIIGFYFYFQITQCPKFLEF